IVERKRRDLPVMAWATQDHYLRLLKKLFGLARSRWSISDDPTLNIVPVGQKSPSKEDRHPFTAQQLQIIFSAPLYTACKNDADGYNIPGPRIVRSTRFWIPLLALYTGMRLNEICQLDVADVRPSKTGHMFISVNKERLDKTLKNQQSKRHI